MGWRCGGPVPLTRAWRVFGAPSTGGAPHSDRITERLADSAYDSLTAPSESARGEAQFPFILKVPPNPAATAAGREVATERTKKRCASPVMIRRPARAK